MKGNAIITYYGADETSSCVISTPLTDVELSNGTFYFQVKDNQVLVFVLKGFLKCMSDRITKSISVGNTL